MKVISSGGKRVLAFDSAERIELEFKENSCVIVPASKKQRALDILAEQNMGHEASEIEAEEYWFIQAKK
ncbi:hypothetical protein [Fictibacillus fluitans]|uniref:AbrB family transcriptional regulator n=1 Tax=Fictibacillus fluitans TaxID=3058422 RepID=A0ABT8HX64_9BACL|nr:hypothetical protein [Fictibacillus sp. NE201]MDN4525360.1 hypothetical protein [Fictibacillus sp. NE201]